MLTLTSGTRVEIARWGAPSALTIVLLHEGLGCVALWRGFPAALAAATGLGVFAWSRPGYGASDPVPLPRPLDYMERAARDDVPAVLDAAGIGDCILLGHSDGASIAAMVDDPRVRGRILIAPHYFVEDAGLDAIRRTADAYRDGDLRARLAKYHADPDNAFHGWSGAWLDPGFRTWRIVDRVRRDAPILQLQGDADPYGTTAQTDAIAGPGVTTLVLDARHAPHLEAPEISMAAIQAFLPGLEKSPRRGVD